MKQKHLFRAMRLVALAALVLLACMTPAASKYIEEKGIIINYEYSPLTPNAARQPHRGFDIVYTTPILVTPGTQEPNSGTNYAEGPNSYGAELTITGPAGWYAFELRGGRGGNGIPRRMGTVLGMPSGGTANGGVGGPGAVVRGCYYFSSGTIALQAAKGGAWEPRAAASTTPAGSVPRANYGGGSTKLTWYNQDGVHGNCGAGGGGYSAIWDGVADSGTLVAVAGGGGGGGGGNNRPNQDTGVGGNAAPAGQVGVAVATGTAFAANNPALTGSTGGGGGGGGGPAATWNAGGSSPAGGAAGTLAATRDGNPTFATAAWVGRGGDGGRGAMTSWNTDDMGGGGGSTVGGTAGPNPNGTYTGIGEPGDYLYGGDGNTNFLNNNTNSTSGNGGNSSGGGGGGGYYGGGGGSRGWHAGGGGGGGSSYLAQWVYPVPTQAQTAPGSGSWPYPGTPSTTWNSQAGYNGYVWIVYLGPRFPGTPAIAANNSGGAITAQAREAHGPANTYRGPVDGIIITA